MLEGQGKPRKITGSQWERSNKKGKTKNQSTFKNRFKMRSEKDRA